MSGATQTDMVAPEAFAPEARGRDMLERALHVVRENALLAMGAGAVPIPVLDVLGIAAVQLRMVKQLCGIYEVEFSERTAKSVIVSLLASTGSVAIGMGVLGSMLKAVPLVGQAAGAAAVGITAGAVVHAVGNVFVQHFNAKGTLQTLDPATMRGYLRDELEKAKTTIRKSW